jgi:hypothetical protein
MIIIRLATAQFGACLAPQDGAIPMHKSSDNSKALEAFITRKTEIDTILARLIALEHDRLRLTPA